MTVNPNLPSRLASLAGLAVAGAFAAGYMSDLVFRHRRPPVALIGYALQVVSLAVVWHAPSTGADRMLLEVRAENRLGVRGLASMALRGRRPAAVG